MGVQFLSRKFLGTPILLGFVFAEFLGSRFVVFFQLQQVIAASRGVLKFTLRNVRGEERLSKTDDNGFSS